MILLPPPAPPPPPLTAGYCYCALVTIDKREGRATPYPVLHHHHDIVEEKHSGNKNEVAAAASVIVAVIKLWGKLFGFTLIPHPFADGLKYY